MPRLRTTKAKLAHAQMGVFPQFPKTSLFETTVLDFGESIEIVPRSLHTVATNRNARVANDADIATGDISVL